MAFFRGPNVVTNGLVLALDAANPKSYVSGSTTWNDLSGNNNNGTIFGSPSYDSSNGGGLYLNSAVSNAGINCGELNNLPQNAISFVIWFKQYGGGFLFNRSGTSSSFGLNLQNNTSTRFQMYSASVTPSPINLIAGTIENNKYYQVCSTYNGTTANTYINGSLVGTQNSSLPSVNFSGSFQIGYRSDGANTNYSSCSIYNVQIYNKSLSSQEVLQNYNALKSRFNLN
jgi:hypothetical protein